MGTDDSSIGHEVVIEAPIEVVWRTITEADQIAQWLADRVELDARPGGQGRLVFSRCDGGVSRIVPLVVEAVEPPHRFSFRWNHPEHADPRPGNSLVVEFTLVAEAAARTRLRVVERGLAMLGWPKADTDRYAHEHRAGWARYLGRLAESARQAAVGRPGR